MPTVKHFEEVLQNPTRKLAEVLGGREFSIVKNSDGAKICCNSRFAEATVQAKRGLFLVSMPLSEAVRIHLTESLARTVQLYTPHIATCCLIPDAIRYTTPDNKEISWDLVVEKIPEGITLSRANEQGAIPPTITQELRKLQNLFHQTEFVHSSLDEESIIIRPDGSLAVFRLYKSHFGVDFEQDDNSLEQIIAKFSSTQRDDMPTSELKEYEPVEFFCDGLIRYRQGNHYGFKDRKGKVVVKAKYLWAAPFYEQRAVVRKRSGVGVIDTLGRPILDTIFQDIFYDTSHSTFHVKLGNDWAIRGYDGERITEYSKEYAPENYFSKC